MNHRQLSVLLGLPLAVIGGLAMAVQGRVNGALGAVLNDGLAAAVVSFGSGLLLIAAISLILPSGRRGLRSIKPVLQARKFPLWYLCAGTIGAFLVMTQGVTVAAIGIALFTVAMVTGQSLSGLLVDRIGLSPAGTKRITGTRIISVVLTITAVAWAVSPRFAQSESVWNWLLPVLLPLLGGFLTSFQQAMNGTQTVHYGTPLTATVINFVVGTIVLLIAWLFKLALAGAGNTAPSEWWYYIGGALGCFVIGLSAWLVRGIGVLLTGLGLIAGQLIGSLALDLTLPTAGTVIAAATWFGTLLALAAVLLATAPWPKKGLLH